MLSKLLLMKRSLFSLRSASFLLRASIRSCSRTPPLISATLYFDLLDIYAIFARFAAARLRLTISTGDIFELLAITSISFWFMVMDLFSFIRFLIRS